MVREKIQRSTKYNLFIKLYNKYLGCTLSKMQFSSIHIDVNGNLMPK